MERVTFIVKITLNYWEKNQTACPDFPNVVAERHSGTCKCFMPLCSVRHCIVHSLVFFVLLRTNKWLTDWLIDASDAILSDRMALFTFCVMRHASCVTTKDPVQDWKLTGPAASYEQRNLRQMCHAVVCRCTEPAENMPLISLELSDTESWNFTHI